MREGCARRRGAATTGWNLERFYSAFIGGTLVRHNNSASECVQGATVQAYRGGTCIAECVSEVFGDFRMDGLAKGSDAIELVISRGTEPPLRVEIVLNDSLYLGKLVI
jgi:hypothetical protein